jgi:hypothetical protein
MKGRFVTKNLVLILTSILLLLPTVAPAQRELWQIPGTYIFAFEDASGHVYLCNGQTPDDSLKKVTSEGELLWTKPIGWNQGGFRFGGAGFFLATTIPGGTLDTIVFYDTSGDTTAAGSSGGSVCRPPHPIHTSVQQSSMYCIVIW